MIAREMVRGRRRSRRGRGRGCAALRGGGGQSRRSAPPAARRLDSDGRPGSVACTAGRCACRVCGGGIMAGDIRRGCARARARPAGGEACPPRAGPPPPDGPAERAARCAGRRGVRSTTGCGSAARLTARAGGDRPATGALVGSRRAARDQDPAAAAWAAKAARPALSSAQEGTGGGGRGVD